MKGLGILLALGLVSALPASALACTVPPLPEIEGEKPEMRALRETAFLREWSEQGSRQWQAFQFDNATSIFLGRVTARRDLKGLVVEDFRKVVDRPPRYEADVLPLAAIRGSLPQGEMTVSWNLQLQCRFFEPGAAASAYVGTPVLVFEIAGELDGFPITMARDPRLVAALKRHPEAMQQ